MTGMQVGSPSLAHADALVPRGRLAEGRGADAGAVGSAFRDLTFSLHAGLDGLVDEWRAFERVADCTVFQTAAWLADWQATVGKHRGTLPAIVVGRNAAGNLKCIFQLAIERGGPGRKLTWLGSELCDYNAPLLARDFSATEAGQDFAGLWRHLEGLVAADPRFRFDYVDLEKMPPRLGRLDNPFLSLPVTAHPSGAHVATLAGDWESFYAARRSSSTRKTERKQLKQLAAAHGEVRFVEVSEPREVAATMDALIEQKTKSFARMGIENLFARAGYRDFYTRIATDPAMRDIVHVSRLEVGGVVAATSLGLRFNGCYYLILSSYQDGDLSRYGTGRIHLRELLKTAIERDFTLFDFTVGDEAYKNEWCDVELRLVDYLAARTALGLATVSAIQAYRRTKRLIKQTPALWAAYSRARSAAGGLKRRLGR